MSEDPWSRGAVEPAEAIRARQISSPVATNFRQAGRPAPLDPIP